MNNYKVVSLFCGCGGADLGVLGGFNFLRKNYKKNPVTVVHASDINQKAVNTYNANFQHKAVVNDARELIFESGFADIVIGGFPCQSFSTVNPTKKPGNRETQLFWEMAKVIDMIKPKAIIAENVKGFYRLHDGKYFKLAMKEFDRLGYYMNSQLINSSNFGVPQLRERIFMVGIRKDLEINFEFPQFTHGEKPLRKKAVLNDVIDSLESPDPKYIFSQRAVDGVKKAKNNMKRALAQNLNSQCLTITSHLAKVSINSRDPILLIDKDNEKYRRFTPREAARIQSFPDKFKFEGSEGDAYRQIGNAIAPVVMWHVFQELVKTLNK